MPGPRTGVDDEEICGEEVGQEDCGEARPRQGACQKGPGRQISGTHRRIPPRRPQRLPWLRACRAEARDAYRPSPDEPVHAASDSRYASAEPDGITEPSRAAVAGGSPGFACGATTRNAGAAFGSQQYPVDVGSWGWPSGASGP